MDQMTETLNRMQERLDALAARMEGQPAQPSPLNLATANALGEPVEFYEAKENCRLAIENVKECARRTKAFNSELSTANLDRLAAELTEELNSFYRL